MRELTGAKRPWWADPKDLRDNLDRREHDAALDYLGVLADLVETAIAYGPEEPAEAAGRALADLDRSRWLSGHVWGPYGADSLPLTELDEIARNIYAHPVCEHSACGPELCLGAVGAMLSYPANTTNERASGV
ncbi:hypothetical protein SEA_BOOSTSEASON_57 [Mycobacterium phage BoostSeason]|nr:hypothetical protein SEA_BOOSTSEASON_57 [Mycobacterium phage BoostSeason]